MPKSEQKKKVDKFRIFPICCTSNSGFLSWLRNYYSCQYEFRQFNQVLSKARRKLIYSGLRTVLFEFFEAKFTESKSNLSLVLCRPAFHVIRLSLPLSDLLCRSVFKWVSNRFFFLHFQILVKLPKLFFESLLAAMFPSFLFIYFFVFAVTPGPRASE